MNDQGTTIPVEPYVQALARQRNAALDRQAELEALNSHYVAEVERLTAENNKFREEQDGPFGGS